MWVKRFSIFSLVLLLVCSWLWAFPGRQKASGTETAIVEEPQISAVEEEKNTSGTLLESILIQSQASSKKDVTLTQMEIQAIERELAEAKDDLAVLEKISKEKDEAINKLTQVNNNQADRIAAAEAEQGTKPYMLASAIMGFEDNEPTIGVGATLGLRIGNSMMVEAGADYSLG